MTSITKKAGSLLAIGLSTASVLGGALPAAQSVFAEGNKTEVTTKQADVAQVVAKANIDDSKMRENLGNAFSQSYTLNLTVPDSVKAGSVATIKVENLPNLFGSGDVKSVDITVDGTVIGKAHFKRATIFRNQQIDAKTSFDQKKAANIKAGFGELEYEIVFNDKATNFKNKDIVFKSASENLVFTEVSKDTTVKAKIIVNDKEVATKDITIKPSTYQDDKVKTSTLDLSANTQMIKNNDGTINYWLGVGVRPMDQDYGVGDKITVTLPRDSMMKFTKQDVTAGKEIRIIPAFTKNSFANENNVLLSDTNAVTAKVAELNDNKVVFEITGGTLKRVNYYVFSTDATGASFRLTDKAAGKLAADGKSFGPETVTSSITTKDGRTNPTEINTSSISVNGATLTAKGVQEIIEKPDEEPVTDDTDPKEKDPKEDITTFFKDDKGNIIKTGKGTKDKEDIPGYKYLRTEKDKDGNTTHIYHKIVTRHVENKDGKVNVLKEEDGDQPKSTFPGYEYQEKKVDPKTGDVTHHYKATPEAPKETPKEDITTFFKDDKGNVIKTGKGPKDKEDIPGYKYLRTEKDKDGNTIHIYHKIVTRHVENKDGKVIVLKEEEGNKPKSTFKGYDFVETKVDSENGDVTHHYKANTQTPDKKDAVKTGASAGRIILPLLGVGATAVIGGAAYLKTKKKK